MLKVDSGMPGPFGAGKPEQRYGGRRIGAFGGTGDLARKKIYPALLARRAVVDLGIPVIAVARAPGDASTLRAMVHDSLQQQRLLDDVAFAKLSPCSITSGAITAIPGLRMRCVAGSARRCARSTIWRSLPMRFRSSSPRSVVWAAPSRRAWSSKSRSAATSSLRSR